MKRDYKAYYIWLLSVMGAANPRTTRLIAHFGGVKQVYDALTAGDSKHKLALKPWEAKSLKAADLEKSAELIEWCSKRNYNIITIEDKDYPEQLKHIYNPPIVLFTEGDVSALDSGSPENPEIRINVIGTRNPSEYSYTVSSHICAELAKTGITIISGMAVGLDKSSMTAALENNGTVAGVLACGIDVEYPRGSKEFRKSVIDSGGVCISELMPRDSTRPTYFQYRNRIMSGLSSGTLIIEAGERSGCHITALHTISQNRDLFCIPPHDILDPRYSGVIRYLRDGAIPVFSYIDIINEYLSDVCERLADSSATPGDLEKPDTPPALTFKTKTQAPQATPKADYEQLPPEQLKIIKALQRKRLTFDELVRKNLCDPDKTHEILLDMELDGIIERIAGDRYAIKK